MVMDLTFLSLLALFIHGFAAWVLTQFIFSLLKQAHVWNPRRLPPGPFPLPIIGNLHCLGKMPHRSLAEIGASYGDLVTLQLGTLTTIIVSSASRAEEVLREHDATFSYRPTRQTSTIIDHHLHSVFYTPSGGQWWRFLRKIGNAHIFATNRLDAGRELRRKKVEELLCYVQECCNTSTAVNISQAAFSTSLNILSNTFFSMDLSDLRSDAGHELKALFSTIMALSGTPNIADFFPLLGPIDPQGIRRRSKVAKETIAQVFDRMIEQRTSCRRKESRDVLDLLINIKEENKEEFDIRFFLLDLFIAGMDTTSSTIERAMLELLNNPDKMRKALTELDQVIGRGKQIEDTDVAELPYLRAVIKETLRLHPPVSLILRKTNAEVGLRGGYSIPKDTQVWINVWAIGRDKRVWKDAELFQPDRFLDMPPLQEVDYRGQNYELIPFGSGRRICLGLSFAHRVLHLVLGSLINCFDWKPPMEGERSAVDIEEKLRLALQKARPLCVVPLRPQT